MQKDVELEGMNNKPTIHVDADACPVKDEILHCASLHEIEVCFVASYKNMMNNPEGKWVYVDADKEAADLYIVNSVKKGDIVVTADIGLAGTLLPKNVYVLSPREKNTRKRIFSCSWICVISRRSSAGRVSIRKGRKHSQRKIVHVLQINL